MRMAMNGHGKYGYTVMNKELEDSVWDKICNGFKFVPDHNDVPYPWIELPAPFKIYQLDFSAAGAHWDRLMNSLFVRMGSSELYALDWQHDCFVFPPRDYWKLVKEYHDEGRNCNVYFPHYYPDGDYCFFVDPKWKYGIFGHPWLMQIAVFGEELIGFVDMHAKMLGLTQTSFATGQKLTNEQRAKALIDEFGFDLDKIDKNRVRQLIEKELSEYQEGSSEYIRLLCGYLYCLGDRSDSELLRKVKQGISFDVGCMIDQEWIDSLDNGGIQDPNVKSREMLIADFVRYYAVKE